MEVPSEDPFLSGKYGVEYTVGLQYGQLDPRYMQAIVTLKHWDAYPNFVWEFAYLSPFMEEKIFLGGFGWVYAIRLQCDRIAI